MKASSVTERIISDIFVVLMLLVSSSVLLNAALLLLLDRTEKRGTFKNFSEDANIGCTVKCY